MIQDRLGDYGCRSALEEKLALREITQEVVLAALGRTDFFTQAAFRGGTCLRIFHGLPRFSEDLDFALTASNSGFQLGPWAGQGLASDDAWCARELDAAIGRLDIERAREDVRRFVKPAEVRSLDLWSREFLLAQNRKLTGQAR